jgi:hypothetical protein
MTREQLFARLIPIGWDVLGEVLAQWSSNADRVEPVKPVEVRGDGDWGFVFFEPPLGSDGGTPVIWPAFARKKAAHERWALA